MAGKSIDDIMRQQAAQRQAQIQQQQAQERAINEQRERQRQDYLQRIRMFEKLSNVNPAAAASAAGGNATKPVINGHAEFILFKTSDLDNWQYVILDYLAETISDVKDTGIINTSGYDTYMIENTGWVVEFDSQILFINDNAEIIETISNTDKWSSWNKRTFYLIYFTDGTVKYFDGKVLTTYTGLPASSIITDTGFTKNGYLAITTQDSDVATVYVWNPANGLVEIWTGPDQFSAGDRWNSMNVSDSADFFTVGIFNDATPDTWKTILVFNEDGTSKSDLDLSPVYSVSRVNSGFPQFFGTNKMEWKFTGPTSSWNFSVYDGDTDTWRSSTHVKGSNYNTDQGFYQNHYDGSQYTSLGNSIFRLLYDESAGYPGASGSAYNIDLYRHLDIVWSVDGSTYSSYTVNNTTTWTKGVDVNDADRDGFNDTSLYLGKSIFLPMWLADSTFRLLCLTSTQSVNIAVGSNTGLNGTQGDGLIPGWNTGQRYASFRVGDNFGVWLAYASADVYKIYNEVGTNVISLTMSAGTRLNYTGDLAVVSNNTTGIEYVFNANTLGASPSYVTYSVLPTVSHYGLKPTYTDGDTTPSLMLNLNEGGLSRIFNDEDVYEFTVPELNWGRWLSDEYIILEGRDGANFNLYFYDWTGTLLATVDTGIPTSASYDANLVKDRVYFKVVDGSTTTYYYFSPTKSDSFSVENLTSDDVNYDYWSWWID
jgi:hypothetical protein